MKIITNFIFCLTFSFFTSLAYSTRDSKCNNYIALDLILDIIARGSCIKFNSDDFQHLINNKEYFEKELANHSTHKQGQCQLNIRDCDLAAFTNSKPAIEEKENDFSIIRLLNDSKIEVFSR